MMGPDEQINAIICDMCGGRGFGHERPETCIKSLLARVKELGGERDKLLVDTGRSAGSMMMEIDALKSRLALAEKVVEAARYGVAWLRERPKEYQALYDALTEYDKSAKKAKEQKP